MNWKSRVERGTPILYNLPPQNIYSYILGYCDELEGRIEAVQKQLDEIMITLENINSSTHGQKSDLMLEVEERYGKNIEELLSERKGKSIREIAAEFGISKSSAANWLREWKDEQK